MIKFKVIRYLLLILPVSASAGVYVSGNIGTSLLTGLENYIPIFDPNIEKVSGGQRLSLKIDAGYEFNNYFGAEINYSFYDRVKADEYSVSTYSIGILGVASYPVSKKHNVFGKLGAIKSKASSDVYGITISKSDQSMAYGLGVEYMLNNKISLTTELSASGTNDEKISYMQSIYSGIKYRFN